MSQSEIDLDEQSIAEFFGLTPEEETMLNVSAFHSSWCSCRYCELWQELVQLIESEEEAEDG